MPQEELSVRDQIRAVLRADPQLLDAGLADFQEATGIETHSSELWKMKAEMKAEMKAKARKRKSKKRRAQKEEHDQRVAESKARRKNGVTREMRLQVALAALRPLMEQEGLEELVLLRDPVTGEVTAEARGLLKIGKVG